MTTTVNARLVGGSTWVVERITRTHFLDREPDSIERLGVVNYPGNDPVNRFFAHSEKGENKACATLDSAVDFLK